MLNAMLCILPPKPKTKTKKQNEVTGGIDITQIINKIRQKW